MFFKRKPKRIESEQFFKGTPEITVTKTTVYDSEDKIEVRYSAKVRYGATYICLATVNSEEEVAKKISGHFRRNGQGQEATYTFNLYEETYKKVEVRESITEVESKRISGSLEKILKEMNSGELSIINTDSGLSLSDYNKSD